MLRCAIFVAVAVVSLFWVVGCRDRAKEAFPERCSAFIPEVAQATVRPIPERPYPVRSWTAPVDEVNEGEHLSLTNVKVKRVFVGENTVKPTFFATVSNTGSKKVNSAFVRFKIDLYSPESSSGEWFRSVHHLVWVAGGPEGLPAYEPGMHKDGVKFTFQDVMADELRMNITITVQEAP